MDNIKQQQSGPSETTNKVIEAISGALKTDKIDNPWPTFENWHIGYADSPQIRTGKRRFFYYELEDKTQAMIVFSHLRERGMTEEQYHISMDSKVKYIMIYHD